MWTGFPSRQALGGLGPNLSTFTEQVFGLIKPVPDIWLPPLPLWNLSGFTPSLLPGVWDPATRGTQGHCLLSLNKNTHTHTQLDSIAIPSSIFNDPLSLFSTPVKSMLQTASHWRQDLVPTCAPPATNSPHLKTWLCCYSNASPGNRAFRLYF